ncbi:MAG: amino acid adenylation domain-containing protein [Magnetococcales bacterium]|nr:amino acid adenylation domain-containing protein [Magnetococcales bacterium]
MYRYNLGLRFAAMVTEHGQRPALLFADGAVLTYEGLDRLADTVAGRLVARGARAGDVICLTSRKIPVVFAAIIACWKLGLSYAVVDRQSPPERLQRILDNCRPRLILADTTLAQRLQDCGWQGGDVLAIDDLTGCAAAVRSVAPVPVTGDHPAYIMYTSGSTGFPKGAVMTHRNLLNFIDWCRTEFEFGSGEVLANVNPLFFDNSVFDLYAALMNGATLLPCDRELLAHPEGLIAHLEAAGCTSWFSVPSLLIYLTRLNLLGPERLPGLRRFIFGGEGYPKAQLVRLWENFGHRAAFFNVYGPTECTCICSALRLGPETFADLDGLPPLGPLARNFEGLLLDEDGRPAAGEEGELCLLGPNVGAGYYRDPERTAAVFVQNPRQDAFRQIAYRTGDQVRRDPATGHLHFIGRRDNQIKHMGYRIELGEIEAALNGLPGVAEAGVVHVTFQGMKQILAAVAVNGTLTAREIKARLGSRLPDYMVPRRIVILEQLPKNANGKIDRRDIARRLEDPAVARKEENRP